MRDVLNISDENNYFLRGWLGEVLRGIETYISILMSLGILVDLPFLQGK